LLNLHTLVQLASSIRLPKSSLGGVLVVFYVSISFWVR
jgi:hypothetical protein